MDDAEATSSTTRISSEDEGDSAISFAGPVCNSEGDSSRAEESAQIFNGSKRDAEGRVPALDLSLQTDRFRT